MALVRTYTTAEVGRILKLSEGAGVPAGRGQGHAEGLHAIGAAGRGRESTDQAALEERLLDERKSKVGAFDNCQIAAVTTALNSQAGQNSLQYLAASTAEHVFVRLSIETGTYRMVLAESELPAGGTRRQPAAGPMTAPASRTCPAPYIAMKLMKGADGELHIRTAFPLDTAPPGGATCSVTYTGSAQAQTLPV